MRLVNASRKLAARAVSFSGVLFRQFVDDDLGCASYLIGDPSKGEAFLVDPAYAIEQYLEAAHEAGVRIVRVLETHTHADHVSGHGRFSLEHGVYLVQDLDSSYGTRVNHAPLAAMSAASPVQC